MNSSEDKWHLLRGTGPVLAVALHAGNRVPTEFEPYLAVTPADRLREEDPHTEKFLGLAQMQWQILTSRFVIDLNRPREKAIYQAPAEAWGLMVWKGSLPENLRDTAYGIYDRFYCEAGTVLRELIARHRHVLILDLHSYNHRRGGADAQPADPKLNPEINLGTGRALLPKWRPLVEAWLEAARNYTGTVTGRKFDVRENVKFSGGYFQDWVQELFGENVCVLSIEMKKIFMDEWTNQLHPPVMNDFYELLFSALQGAKSQLLRMSSVGSS